MEKADLQLDGRLVVISVNEKQPHMVRVWNISPYYRVHSVDQWRPCRRDTTWPTLVDRPTSSRDRRCRSVPDQSVDDHAGSAPGEEIGRSQINLSIMMFHLRSQVICRSCRKVDASPEQAKIRIRTRKCYLRNSAEERQLTSSSDFDILSCPEFYQLCPHS